MAKILEKIKQIKEDFFEKKGAFTFKKMEAEKLIRTIDFSDAETCQGFLEALINNASENHTKPFNVIFENTTQLFANRRLGDSKTINEFQSVSDAFKSIKLEQVEHGNVKYKNDYEEAVEKPIIALIKSCVDAVENFKDGDSRSLLLAQTALLNLRALKKASEPSDFKIGINVPGFDFRRFENPSAGLQANIENLDAIAMAQQSNKVAAGLINELLPGHGTVPKKKPSFESKFCN